MMAGITPEVSLAGSITPEVSIGGKVTVPEIVYLQGLQGEKGEPGPKGDTGPQGERGEKGDAFTYADFTEEQLAALKGPKGDTGAKGDKGDRGPQGEQGNPGESGAPGADGHTPVITAEKTGKVTTIKADGVTVATVSDGVVATVNSKAPDASGNVSLTGGDIPMSASDDTTVPEAIAAKQTATNGLTAEAALAEGDYFPFYDASAAANRKTPWSNILSKIGSHIRSAFASTPLAVNSGGTGATDAATARANLGVELGNIVANNAGAHNAVYGGRSLGSSVTAAQWAAIQVGTFDDLFIGDYWTINDVNWRIAAFDYYYNTGDVACTTHHVVIVPEASLYETAMNSSQSTAGGYVASTMYTSGLAAALATVKSAFGDDHILTHRQIFCNAVTNGIPSGYGFYDNQIALMTEQNVFGGKFYGAAKTSTQTPSLMTLDNAQYPLFAHNHALINVPDKWVGLRDVVSATSYARVTSRGSPDYTANITNPIAVRPAFSIKA